MNFSGSLQKREMIEREERIIRRQQMRAEEEHLEQQRKQQQIKPHQDLQEAVHLLHSQEDVLRG